MRIAEIKGALTYFGQKQLESTRNIILTGAPGTGKTWSAKNIAAWMIKEAPYDDSMQNDSDFKRQCRFVQFHPSYDYTDFVEGLRPISNEDNNSNSVDQIGFKRINGVFKDFCKEALREVNTPPVYKSRKWFVNKKKKYVFIIDEINRGEMSKILGELFYSIDPGYRGIDGKVNTQYQNMIKNENDPFKDGFYVPENVYIVGTMNDIDRSVESMDFAMRRRFSFLEVMAKEREDMWNQSIPEWKEYAKVAMEALNDEIEKLPGLSSAYHIGPAYFNKLKLYNGDFFELWDKHLKGVIFEYMRGKKDTETKLKELKAYYINAYAKEIDSRFNSGGKWGKKVIDLWEKSKLPNSFTFNKFEDEKAGSPNDQDKAKNNNKQTKEAIKKELDNYAINKLSPDLNNESVVKKQIFRALTFGKYIESLK